MLLALFLIMTFTSCTSYDENCEIYDLLVAGVKVTTRNAPDILGIYMVKKSMDDITYEYKNGQNILTIKKNLN